MFAPTDHELGEVELAEQKIMMKGRQLIRAPPHQLPYALRDELQSELGKLLDTSYVEHSV